MTMPAAFSRLCLLRHSSRQYSSEPLTRDEIEGVLEAARLAPSACNRQPWRFIVVTSKDKRERLLAKSRPAFIDAPVLIVAVGLHAQAWHRPSDGKDHTDVDVAIAVEHLCLAAAEAGIDTCWVCSFDTQAATDVLVLAPDEEPIALIPMGRASTPAPDKTRKPLDEIVEYAD